MDRKLSDYDIRIFLIDIGEPYTETNINHARCGFHSGIPPCCITFFIKIWTKLIRSLPDFYESYAKSPIERDIRRIMELYQNSTYKTDYICCPNCFITGRVEPLRECDCTKKGYVR